MRGGDSQNSRFTARLPAVAAMKPRHRGSEKPLHVRSCRESSAGWASRPEETAGPTSGEQVAGPSGLNWHAYGGRTPYHLLTLLRLDRGAGPTRCVWPTGAGAPALLVPPPVLAIPETPPMAVCHSVG